MPRGPKGQKRPADAIGNAVRVMEIATGQREEEFDPRDEGKDKAAAELGRKGGTQTGTTRFLQAENFKLTHYRLCSSFAPRSPGV